MMMIVMIIPRFTNKVLLCTQKKTLTNLGPHSSVGEMKVLRASASSPFEAALTSLTMLKTSTTNTGNNSIIQPMAWMGIDCWSVYIRIQSRKLANQLRWAINSYLWPSRIDIAVFGVRGSPDYPKHKDNLHVDGNADGDISVGGSSKAVIVVLVLPRLAIVVVVVVEVVLVPPAVLLVVLVKYSCTTSGTTVVTVLAILLLAIVVVLVVVVVVASVIVD